jgi:hypothetical protein
VARLTLEGLEQRIDNFEAIMGNHAREVSALAGEVRRLADQLERQLERAPVTLPRPMQAPAVSWHQQLAQKQVPMGRAVGWSTVALAALELLHAIADGHLKVW